jgi:DNA-binding response OmpR family regulator
MVSNYSGNILVVDDSEDNRVLLERILRKSGYCVVEAQGGLEAIEAIASNGRSFDVVLLDWMMPGLSGVDVLRAAREHFDADELPIIMCTARDEGEAVSAALAEGANDYVSKPVNRDVLLARVASQIKRCHSAAAQKEDRERLEDTLVDRTTALAALKRNDDGPAVDATQHDKLQTILVDITEAAQAGMLENVERLAFEALQLLQHQDHEREVA